MANTTEDKLRYLIRSKEDVRLAIERMQISCPEDTPFLDYGPKIKQVDVDLSDSTVTSDDLMEGIIAYDSKEQRLVGTIPDNGRLEYEPSDEEHIIPYGRTDGGKVNKADITKLAEYEACLRIANSVGNPSVYEGTTATAEDILEGKTAYSNGELIIGEYAPSNHNVTMSMAGITNQAFTAIKTFRIMDFSNLDTSNMKYFASAFKDFASLKEIIGLNTNQAIYTHEMFKNCTSLEVAPELNISKVTIANDMFNGCAALKEVPLYNMNKLDNGNSMFRGCTSLTSIPLFNTPVCTNMAAMFYDCTNLKDVPILFTVNANTMTSMFYNCPSLSDDSLNNILQMCSVAPRNTSTKTLKSVGLSEEQATKCQSLSNWAAFTAAGWSTGY